MHMFSLRMLHVLRHHKTCGKVRCSLQLDVVNCFVDLIIQPPMLQLCEPLQPVHVAQLRLQPLMFQLCAFLQPSDFDNVFARAM